MINAVYTSIKDAINNNDVKVYMVDATTGSGKTQSIVQIVAEEYIKYLKGKSQFSRVVFVANLKSQFISKDIEQYLKNKFPLDNDYIHNKILNDFVEIESVADDINQNALDELYDFLKNINSSKTTTVCENIKKYKKSKEFYTNYTKQKDISTELVQVFRNDYSFKESNLRKSIKYLWNKRSKIPEIDATKLRKKIERVWKQTTIENKFFVEMHIKKCMHPIDTIFGKEYNITKDKGDKSFLHNALLFIDEPDTAFCKMHDSNIEDMQKTAIKIKDFLITTKLSLDNFCIYRGNNDVVKKFHKQLQNLKNEYDKFDKEIVNILADYRVIFHSGQQKSIFILGNEGFEKNLYLKVNDEKIIDIVDIKPNEHYISFSVWQNAVLHLINQTIMTIKQISEFIYEEQKELLMTKSECYRKTMSEFGFDNTKNPAITEAIERTALANSYIFGDKNSVLNIVCIEQNNNISELLSNRPFEVSVFIKTFDETDQLITMVDNTRKTILCSATGNIDTFIGNFDIQKIKKHYKEQYCVFSDNEDTLKHFRAFLSEFQNPLKRQYNIKTIEDLISYTSVPSKISMMSEYSEVINSLTKQYVLEKSDFHKSRNASIINSIITSVYTNCGEKNRHGTNILVFTPMTISLNQESKEKLERLLTMAMRLGYLKKTNIQRYSKLNVRIQTATASSMKQIKDEYDNDVDNEYQKIVLQFATNINQSVNNGEKFCNILFLPYACGDTGINLKIPNIEPQVLEILIRDNQYAYTNDFAIRDMNYDTLIATERTHKTGIETQDMQLVDKLKTMELVFNAFQKKLLSPQLQIKIQELLNNGSLQKIPSLFSYDKKNPVTLLPQPTTKTTLPTKNLLTRTYDQLLARRQRGNVEPLYISFYISQDIDFNHMFSEHTGLNKTLLCNDIKEIYKFMLKNELYDYDCVTTRSLDKQKEKIELQKNNEFWAFLNNKNFAQHLNDYRKGNTSNEMELYKKLKCDKKLLWQYIYTNEPDKNMEMIFGKSNLPSLFIKNQNKTCGGNYYYKQNIDGTFKISYEPKFTKGWHSFLLLLNRQRKMIEKLYDKNETDFQTSGTEDYVIGPWLLNLLIGDIGEKFFLQNTTAIAQNEVEYTDITNCKNTSLFEVFDFLVSNEISEKYIAIDVKNSTTQTEEDFRNLLIERRQIKEIKEKTKILKGHFGVSVPLYIVNVHPHKITEFNTGFKQLQDANGNYVDNIFILNNCYDENCIATESIINFGTIIKKI